MDAVLLPFIAHEFKHLLPLFEVEILLRGHNVYALVEVIMLLAVYCRSDISRHVETRSIRLGYHGCSESVRLKIDYLSALRLYEQAFVLEFFNESRHLVRIEALSRVRIEFDIEHVIHTIELRQAELSELLP